MDHEVRTITWRDEEAWLAHWMLTGRIGREVFGPNTWQPTPEQATERVRTTPNRQYCHLNVLVNGEVVGFGRVRTMLDDDPPHSQLDLGVLSEHRSQGIGGDLMQRLLEAAQDHGSRRVDCFIAAHRDNPSAADAGNALADKLGMTVNAIDEPRELTLPRSWDQPDVPGYSFEVVTGAPPPELYDDLRILQQGMNTDVPQGEVALPVENWTDDRLAARFDPNGERLWLVLARDASGTIAGYTELANPDNAATHHLLQQGDTIVLPAHRGHGLGRALKVTAMTRAQQDAPWLTVAQTNNDITNTHMIAINDWLGFEVMARLWNRTLMLD